MKVFIFGRQSVGDKIYVKMIQDGLGLETEFLGERVDLSRINPEEENLIIVINSSVIKTDLEKVVGYIRKDLSRPMMVVNKLKAFGGITFKENFKIDHVISNKIFLFSGIMYLPKKYLITLMGKKRTISNILHKVPKDDWGIYMINGRK